MTTTVAIAEKYVETLAPFGSLQEAVAVALQRYAIELLTTKINELRRQEATYQQRYGLDYPSFTQRMTEDIAFVQHVETTISKTWELDLAEWEFCHEGIKDWTRKLQSILLT